MSGVSDVDTATLDRRVAKEADDVLGTKAVTDRSNLLEAFLLAEVLDAGLDDWVDLLEGVWVVTVGTLGQPAHDVKVVWAVERNWVAVEQIWHDGVVALWRTSVWRPNKGRGTYVGGVLIGYQLAVLPDTNDIWQVEDSMALMDNVALWLGDVGLNVANLDDRAGRLAIMLNTNGAAL
jgi:hypothetical protein